MKIFLKSKSSLVDWAIAGVLGAVAAIVYFASCADYAFPGESAHLMAIWSGLDCGGAVNEHPLMGFFAGCFGCTNLLAVVLGVILTVTFYHLIAFFVRQRVTSEQFEPHAVVASRLAATVATIILVFTPAVRSAATHLEPSLFDAVWALLAIALFIPQARLPDGLAMCLPPLMGVMVGMGLVDSALFLALLPLYLTGIITVELRRGRMPYVPLFLFVIMGIVAYYVFAYAAAGDFTQFQRRLWGEFKGFFPGRGDMTPALVFVFATLPFAITLFSSGRVFNLRNSWSEWLFHLALSVFSILAVATDLSPSGLMCPKGGYPVVTSAFAAFVAGYLICYWSLVATARTVRARNGGSDENPRLVAADVRRARPLAVVAVSVLGLAFAFTVVFNLFDFDVARGAFADKVATRILKDMGERKWLVTDGRLDDHLRLVAAKSGRELHLVCLQRDLDAKYLERLGEVVKETQLGGTYTDDLLRSLKLGVLPFIQDWFNSDIDIVKKAAVFGAPDLWYSAKIRAVPEFLFFGGNPKVRGDWLGSWREFDGILHAEKGWGSYTLLAEEDPVTRLRLGLRRHLGLMANNTGVALQDAKDDAGAFRMYDLVLETIDRDNVSSLINELVMVRNGYRVSPDRQKELDRRFTAIKDDKDRRYVVWALANYYGYIRTPEVFIRLGYSWVRSGRPGDALNQIRRAKEFVPTDRQDVLLNMMASLYASENEQAKAREVYEQVLAKDSNNHDALIGLMRLAIQDGDSAKAIAYLEKAAKISEGNAAADIEFAILALMKGEYARAKEFLKKVTERDAGNLQAWSLYAAVTIQQIDASKDEAEKSRLLKELTDSVLPRMEKQARSPNDYYLLTTRAFVLLRQGANFRRAARDAFVAASRERRDITGTQDLVLGLDIQLNDTHEAEKHARDVLRRNRKAPLANYVMGSLALRDGNYADAEAYLRRSADAPRPVVLAMNDLAEVLRRKRNFDEAERYARLAVKTAPSLYVAWETLGSILMDRNRTGADRQRDMDEAERCIRKACDLSRSSNGRNEDVRMLVSLARVQLAKGDRKEGLTTLGKVRRREGELSEFEKGELKELMKRVNK